MYEKNRDDQGSKNIDNKKLNFKREEYRNKIERRLENIDNITNKYPDMDELQDINHKFHESYEKRQDVGNAILKAKENCSELKKKGEKFLQQQNMVSIKLKGTDRK